MPGLLARLSEIRVLRALAVALLPAKARSALWAASHDHFTDPSEQFYARIYLNHLLREVNSELPDRRLRVLDLGCGHGRFSIPLAKLGHDVVAVDKNKVALSRARKYAAQLGIKVDFRNTDFWSEQLGQFDLVLAIETFDGSTDDVLKLIELANRCLALGGLFAISIRTRYYQMADCIRRGNYQGALDIATGTRDPKWLEPLELESILQENGHRLIRIVGIGVASGLRLDPFSVLSIPENLTSAQQELLEKIEMQAGSVREVLGCGRYMFAIAKKEKASNRAVTQT